MNNNSKIIENIVNLLVEPFCGEQDKEMVISRLNRLNNNQLIRLYELFIIDPSNINVFVANLKDKIGTVSPEIIIDKEKEVINNLIESNGNNQEENLAGVL